MDRHFSSWSKRNLSILGKIQIYKTFGLSQFLYHLAVLEPDENSWKTINAKISKFIWNKNWASNPAPARIKKEVLLTPVQQGGFGMIDIKEVTTALRLKRHFQLISHNVHPMSELIRKLIEDSTYLGLQPQLEIDEIVTLNMVALHKKRIQDCKVPLWQIESDVILHSNLAKAKIIDLIRPRKRQSAEANLLRRNSITYFKDAVLNGGRLLTTLLKIAIKDVEPALRAMATLYARTDMPDDEQLSKIRDKGGRWIEVIHLTTKKLREILLTKGLINPKITLMDEETKARYFLNLSRLISVSNKSRIIRLLYGDVYCAERLVHFNLGEIDRCRRCFEKETIIHLLVDCPYTKAIYSLMGLQTEDINNILGTDLCKGALEIRCDLISTIVFKMNTIPPEILVRTTFEKYAKGFADNLKVTKKAEKYLSELFGGVT